MRTRSEIEAQDERIVTGSILTYLRERKAAADSAVKLTQGRSDGSLEKRTAASWQKLIAAVKNGLLDEPETAEATPLDNPDREHGFFDQVIIDAKAVIAHMNVVVEQATTCINHGWYGENVSDVTVRAEASEAAVKRIAINARRADMVGANTSILTVVERDIESETGR